MPAPEKAPTPAEAKAMKFADAYINCGFNATEAARSCFKIGSKGGKDPQRTAESMGSAYLRRVEVRKILAKKLKEEFADESFVLENLVKLAKSAKAERDRLKALELLGRFNVMFTDKHEVQGFSIAELVKRQEENRVIVDWDHPFSEEEQASAIGEKSSSV